MQKKLSDREDLSTKDIHDIYYSDSSVDIQLLDELLVFVAQETSLPKAKLRPSDRFAVELAPKKGNEWDSGYGILLFALQSQAKRTGKKLSKKIETLDDYVRSYSELCRE